MIIYNVTLNIDQTIHHQWLHWMQEVHIPDVLATGKFSSARLVKVHAEHEMEGITYAAQYFADSRESLERYKAEDAQRLREDGLRLFGDKMLAFRTELEVISEH